MNNINKVIFDGRISRAPELKYLQTGTAITNFSVAVSGRKNQNGKDEVAFVEVTAWGKTAEYVNSYFNKGSGIVVCGRLTQDSWQDRESGKKQSRLKVTAEEIHFPCGSPRQQSESDPQSDQTAQSRPAQYSAPQQNQCQRQEHRYPREDAVQYPSDPSSGEELPPF